MPDEIVVAVAITGDKDFRNSVEIGNGIFVWTNTNTQSKLSVLSKVLKLYDIDTSELVFYLRDETKDNSDEEGTRFELRRRYWTYALDFIKKAHSEDGCFKNVGASKGSWISGFIGINGFSICCVAKNDSAKVELFIGKSREENKKAFDMLMTHKPEIESAIGNSLIWQRGEKTISSKIYFQMNGVSINKEADWMQMARFHAVWSKRFYDLLVPYLKQYYN